MRENLCRLWRAYSNLFLQGKSPDSFQRAAHFWWNTPLGDVIRTAASALKRRLLPRARLPEPPVLTNAQYRLRALLVLVVAAVVYGYIHGFGEIAMMFVSIPVSSMQHPGSTQAGCFYFFASVFSAALVQNVLYGLFLGRRKDSLRSINGLLFFLMDLFFLNVVDDGVMALSLLVDRIPGEALRYMMMYLAALLGLMTFSDLSGNYLVVLISIAATKLMGLLGTVTYYLCLPGILLVKALGLNSVFPLQFFFDLCIVLITFAFSVVLEHFGMMERLKQLCARLTIAKIFFLLPFALLPLALLL